MALEIKNIKDGVYLDLEEALEPILKSDGTYIFELDKNGMDFLESLTHDGKDASMWISHRLVGKVSQICEGFYHLTPLEK